MLEELKKLEELKGDYVLTIEPVSPTEDCVTTIDLKSEYSLDIISIDKHIFNHYTDTKLGFESFIFKRDGTGDYTPTQHQFAEIEDVYEYVLSLDGGGLDMCFDTVKDALSFIVMSESSDGNIESIGCSFDAEGDAMQFMYSFRRSIENLEEFMPDSDYTKVVKLYLVSTDVVPYSSFAKREEEAPDRLVQVIDDDGIVLLMETNMTVEEMQMSVAGEGLNMTDEEQDDFDESDYEDKLGFISERFGRTFERIYVEEVYLG